MKIRRLTLVLLLTALAVPSWSQEPSPKNEASAARLQEMTQLARAVAIHPSDQPGGLGVELVADPIARYDDQPRRIEDASLWVFGHPGRPVAALKVEIYLQGRGLYGLVSLSPATITADGSDGDGWHFASTSPGIDLKPVPDAPAPAATDRTRLVQMRAIARRFSGFEDETPGKGRLQMRLMPTPLYRYSDPSTGLQDGAIFALAFGVNPDVLILIESRTDAGASSPTWHYGLARLGGPVVVVSLDGKEVWTQGKALPVPAVLPTYMNRHLKRAASGGGG